MKKCKRYMSIFLSLILFVMLLPPFHTEAEAAVTGEARAEFGGENGTELFLGGKYIELGISNWGDFGTLGDKPDHFRGTKGGDANPSGGSNQIGMSADHDGFGQGLDLPVDYYLPGTPEERFAVGYQVDGTTVYSSNSAQMNDMNMPTEISNESDLANDLLKAVTVSKWEDTMEVTQEISFRADQKFYRTEVTIKNISNETWQGARYMRSFDPDNSQFRGGVYDTANTVTHTIAEDGKAVVKAETYKDNDPLFLAFGSRIPFFFYSTDPAAVTSIYGFTNTNPYAPLAYDSPREKGFSNTDDVAITITWDSGPLAPNESKSFVFYSSLDERDFEEVEAEIIIGEGDNTTIQESKANDGTVTGTQKVTLVGATLADDISKAHITVNNLPIGLDFDIERVSDTELSLTFTGAALQHSSEFSLDHVSVTVKKANLKDYPYDLTSDPFEIIFFDPAIIFVDQAVVTESVYGSGIINEAIQITIENGEFSDEVTAGAVVAHHLPPGLTLSVTQLSKTKISIAFDGEATELQDILDAYFTIDAAAIIGSGIDLISPTFKIDFLEIEPVLMVDTPIIYESEHNDGSVAGNLKLQILYGEFREGIVTGDVYGVNLPEGIIIENITRDSDTELTISFGGNAESHQIADSITNAQVQIAASAIDATHNFNGSSVTSNTFSIVFRSPLPSISITPETLSSELDGTITDELFVTLHNGAFTEEVVNEIVVNNLPEGLSAEVTIVSDHVIRITFSGTATKQNPASESASITVGSGSIEGYGAAITSSTFSLRAPTDAALVYLEKDALTWDRIRLENAEMTSVTSNVYLPTLAGYDTTISWASSDEDIIALDGTINRPPFEDDDVTVTLTATITKGGITDTKEFIVTVRTLGAEVKDQLVEVEQNLVIDYAEGDHAGQVTQPIGLPTAGSYGTVITWTSSDEDVIDTEGQVVRKLADEEVTLTARISKDGYYIDKIFHVLVQGTSTVELETDHALLQIIFASEDSEENVKSSVFLPKKGETGSDITWTVSPGGVIHPETGSVTRPGPDEADVVVTVTATITNPDTGETMVKEFELLVPKMTDEEAVIDAAKHLTSANAFDFVVGDTWESTTETFLTLTTGKHDSIITWSSSNTDVIRIDEDGGVTSGVVTRGATDINVILTATIELNGHIVTKDFLIIVKDEAITKDIANTRQPTARNVTASAEPDGQVITENITIYRTELSDGKNIDTVIIEHSDIELLTASINPQDADPANRKLNITMDQVPGDEADEMAVEISANSIAALAERNASLEIVTPEGTLRLSEQVIKQFNEQGTDLYFRVIPVDNADEQQEVKEIIHSSAVIRLALDNNQIAEPLSKPRKIETNYSSYSTFVIFPLEDIAIPQDDAQKRDDFLDRLRVFVEHSDGTTALYEGEIVFDQAGEPIGIQIEIHKFSRFQIVVIADRPAAPQTQPSDTDSDEGKEDIPAGSELNIVVTDDEENVLIEKEIVDTEDGKVVQLELNDEKARTILNEDPEKKHIHVTVDLTQEVDGTEGDGSDQSQAADESEGDGSDQSQAVDESEGDGSDQSQAADKPLGAVFSFSADIAQQLQSRQGSVTLSTGEAQWMIDLQGVDLASLSSLVGLDGGLGDSSTSTDDKISLDQLAVKVSIMQVNRTRTSALEEKIASSGGGVELRSALYEFKAEIAYGDERIAIDRFNKYNTILIPIDHNRITTGVLIREDGSLVHQPTVITIIDGQYYAKIHSFEQGVFGLIWNEEAFIDTDGHWAKEATHDMASRLIVFGVGDERFNPSGDVTRAEFAAMLIRGLGMVTYSEVLPLSEQSLSERPLYQDVPSTAWFNDAVAIASERELVQGYGNQEFRPHAQITRQEVMAILARAMDLIGRTHFAGLESTWSVEDLEGQLNADEQDALQSAGNHDALRSAGNHDALRSAGNHDALRSADDQAVLLSDYTDANEIAPWALDAVLANLKTGIIVGKGDQLAVNDLMTRAEAATAIYRLLTQSGLIQ